MKVEIIDRDYDYWQHLHKMVCSDVVKMSKNLESRLKWNKETGLIIPKIDITSAEISASIGKLKKNDGYCIVITEQFLGWLDDAAEWMNKDVMFKGSLFLSTLNPSADLSLWMHANWLSWVVNHEIGHFVCGHLNRENSYEWKDFGILDNLNSKELKEKVALEYDADVYAASIVFGAAQIVIQDERMTKIKEKYFFDIGMIFCGLFICSSPDFI